MSSVPSTSLSTVDTATVSVPDTTIAPNNSASSLKQLKGSLHLDLSSATSSKKQNITADLLSLIKASPSIEKFLSQASATTPTPTKVLYPTDVTLAQRQYAQGFLGMSTICLPIIPILRGNFDGIISVLPSNCL
uniref:Jun domain-containing protein n=1 Tax=Ascaris lumbricoides TaxID=6252 RepID=A0A0M3I478_ASCLU